MSSGPNRVSSARCRRHLCGRRSTILQDSPRERTNCDGNDGDDDDHHDDGCDGDDDGEDDGDVMIPPDAMTQHPEP